ncbi:maestro heat-like repeat-containing protein family member 1 isoform X2 [Orussus abietinus]|nr:maestro heat-like repeat-containing protein family member 1 isoform X2 [Orussus abietinus]
MSVEEFTSDVEEEAIESLVALGKDRCTEAMGALVTKFEPGIIPHRATIRAIGMLAATNPVDMIPFVKVTLAIALPMMEHLGEDELKYAFCFALGKLAEAVAESGTNPDPFRDDATACFEQLARYWLRPTRDSRLVDAALSAVCPVLAIAGADPDGLRAARLVPVLLGCCRRPATRLSASRALAALLTRATSAEKESLRPLLESVHRTLSELVSPTPFEAPREALLVHYEALRCARALVLLYPEEGLDRILQQLRVPASAQRARALVILRHLVNTLPAEEDAALRRIALAVEESLSEASPKQVVGVIVALAARPAVPLLPAQRSVFVRYMVAHSEPHAEESEACCEALHLLATTLDGAETWLWPALLHALLDQTRTAPVAPILRALVPLASKIDRVADPERFRVLARCLELAVEESGRPAVVLFLRAAAPLLAGRLATALWQRSLAKYADWETRSVELLEDTANLEGSEFARGLAGELVHRAAGRGMAPLFAAVADRADDRALLVDLVRAPVAEGPLAEERARAVGVCARRHPDAMLALMRDACAAEDARRPPARLLGLVRDSRAAACAEAARAGLLRAYAEVLTRADPERMAAELKGHVAPWVIRRLGDCREVATREAGLLALERVAAVTRAAVASGMLPAQRNAALATAMTLLQTPVGHRPLRLYPAILRAVAALARVQPALAAEEREVVLLTVLDRVVAAAPEVDLLLSREDGRRVDEGLGDVCAEVVADSADGLAELFDIAAPWMRSTSCSERRTVLSVLCTVLGCYRNSLRYTYPGGRLEPGRVLGRVLSWSADPEPALRQSVVTCVALAMSVAARHRSQAAPGHPERAVHEDDELAEANRLLGCDDPKKLLRGVETLASTVSRRVAAGEVMALVRGLVDGLAGGESAALAGGVALGCLFEIRGADVQRTELFLVDDVLRRARTLEDAECRRRLADAVRTLAVHHPEKIVEVLLAQPLPFDRATEEAWNALGSRQETGLRVVTSLSRRLESGVLFSEDSPSPRRVCATSMAAVTALARVLHSPLAASLVERDLPELLSTLLAYLAGWLHAEPFGRGSPSPREEVHALLSRVVTVADSEAGAGAAVLASLRMTEEDHVDRYLVVAVRTAIRCLQGRGRSNESTSRLARALGRLGASAVPEQRAVAVALHSELLAGLIPADCSAVWVDAVVTSLHEARTDSAALVRGLAIAGLSGIVGLPASQMNEYYEDCLTALLEGLEEPSWRSPVALESLRGLMRLLAMRGSHSLAPRVLLALRPFLDKEYRETKLAALAALGVAARGLGPGDPLEDHFLSCLPSLAVQLEDPDVDVARATRCALADLSGVLSCPPLRALLQTLPRGEANFRPSDFLGELVSCLRSNLPDRAQELRNAAVRGYSRAENPVARATAALLVGLSGSPRPEDAQKMLQLLRDPDARVRARAASALATSFAA